MTDDCCTPPASQVSTLPATAHQTSTACPTNQQLGKPVDALIVKALLAVSLSEVALVQYNFCPAPDCPTVYYSADGRQCFEESDLRERVFQKHPDDETTFICYCFRHTLGSIRAELIATGASTVADQITAGIQAGQCACDIRNPQEDCCLGNVRLVVGRLKNEIARNTTQEARSSDSPND
jgi:Zinc binding domain